MKKFIVLLVLAGAGLLPAKGQTDMQHLQQQMEQMQKEMWRMFDHFNQQFDLEEGEIRMDTFLLKPYLFGAPGSELEVFPEDFSEQLNGMLEKMMQQFGGFQGDFFDSGEMEKWLKDLQEGMPGELPALPPPGREGQRKQKRKTYTL